MVLSQPIEALPRTSVVTLKKLKSLGINTYYDLLNYFPHRYNDYSLVSKIDKLQDGESVTIIGKVESAKTSYVRRGLNIQKVEISDETGKLEVVWYNQPYLIKLFQKAPYVAISGNVKEDFNKIKFEPKEYEVLESETSPRLHTGKIVPTYPEKRGLSSKTLRDKLNYVLQSDLNDVEFLPKEILKKNNLLAENKAFQIIHSPQNQSDAVAARQRLAFDELFTIQLTSQLVKKNWKKEMVGNKFEIKKYESQIKDFIKKLPFKLTGAQAKVIDEILKDLSSDHPMNRFLQGDVGSGKTVVAAIAAYLAHLSGYKILFMAPTEILANQHFNTLGKFLNKLKIGLRTASTKTKDLHKFDVVIGTHALLNEKLDFKKVGLVVIDEQHRFGVRQRAILKGKSINPHLLTMTATPIPRTVALTLFGELDISYLNEMPKGRVPIKTYLVPKSKRDDMYSWIRKNIKEEGVQIFVVCPLIEESEKETMQSIKAATKEFELLKKIFPEFKLELLHGKMKGKEKEKVMTKFKNNKTQILVSTSVVEVGIDIPNATIMVIEGAERYGLAQLHQLRGRIGRGAKQSYCLLFCEKTSPPIVERLKFFAENTNGAEIAKFDLRRRGAGEIYGTRQHGVFELKIADLTDYSLLEKSQKAVQEFDKNYQLNDFPLLKQKIEEYNVHQIARD